MGEQLGNRTPEGVALGPQRSRAQLHVCGPGVQKWLGLGWWSRCSEQVVQSLGHELPQAMGAAKKNEKDFGVRGEVNVKTKHKSKKSIFNTKYECCWKAQERHWCVWRSV